MTTFLRGIPGLRDELIRESKLLSMRLQNDDLHRERGERDLTMTRVRRAQTQGQIEGLNIAMMYLADDVIILSEAEHDRRFAR